MSDINPTITTKFSFSESYPNQHTFNQPLFLLDSFLKEQTLKKFNNDYTDTDKRDLEIQYKNYLENINNE